MQLCDSINVTNFCISAWQEFKAVKTQGRENYYNMKPFLQSFKPYP